MDLLLPLLLLLLPLLLLVELLLLLLRLLLLLLLLQGSRKFPVLIGGCTRPYWELPIPA